MNPLYRAANNGNVDLFKFLLDGPGAGQALMKSGRDGELPIHAITSVWYLRQDHVEIARLIMEHAPSTIMVKKKAKGGKRVLPIHELMAFSTGGKEVQVGIAKLLIEYGPPEMLRTPTDGYKCKDLPIHFAAEREDNLLMVKLLAEAAPDTLVAQDGYGRFPIHRVPSPTKGLQTMLYLAQKAPHTLNHSCDKHPGSEGGLPLHMAIECGMFTHFIGTNSQDTSEEYFKFLLANSALDTKRPGDRSNVLHVALEKNLPLQLFQHLVRSLRDVNYLGTLIKQQSKYGRTPLHYTNTTSEHIKVIVEACSESELRLALLKDSFSLVGNTPLQTALEHSELWEEDTHHGNSFGLFGTRSYSKDTEQGQKKFDNAFGIVKQFVKACPESLASKNVKGLMPVQIADKQQRPPHVIRCLILADTRFNADTLVVACNHADPSVCYEYLRLFPDICAEGGTEQAHNDSRRGSLKYTPAATMLLVLTAALVAILVACAVKAVTSPMPYAEIVARNFWSWDNDLAVCLATFR